MVEFLGAPLLARILLDTDQINLGALGGVEEPGRAPATAACDSMAGAKFGTGSIVGWR